MSDKIKVAVVGCGSISKLHFDAYQKNTDAEIVAVCDLNRERAEKRASEYGVSKVYTDYRKLLEESGADAVSICTWNNAHAPVSIAALKAGKHVLCEKPLCMTVEEALRVQDAVKNAPSQVFQVGFIRRYEERARILKEFIDGGDIGEIYYAKASCLRRLGNPGGWFSDLSRSGGGPVIDLGVHVIDLCWYLMGSPKVKSVSANTYYKLGNRKNVQHLRFYKAADYDPDKNDVEDLANALIRFENGASILLDVSFTLHSEATEEISARLFGTKGGLEIEPKVKIISEKYNTILNIDPQVDNATFNHPVAFCDEINHFLRAVKGETKTLSPVEAGVEIMKILCAIYESARLGREVML